MDLFTIVLIAIGLAMDAFAVSIVKGMTITYDRRKSALLLGSFFGFFQMFMPVVGWLAGLSFRDIIMSVDHWIAFGLLALIGSKMIYDSIKREDEKHDVRLQLTSVFTLAIATSIDALMVGLSFAFLELSIFEPILVIGVVTFGLSVLGFTFGCGMGKVLGKHMKILGGFILILIGIRILLEHLF
jgi:putative Mn2+ efflux pump MntP